MRLILLTPTNDHATREEVAILQARGYDAISYADLYSAEYRLNRGLKATVATAHVNLLAELCEGAIPVIHPDSQRELVLQVATVCRFAHVPMLRKEDLPVCPPINQEVMDARNCAGDPYGLAKVHESHVYQLMMSKDLDAPALVFEAYGHGPAMRVVRDAAPVSRRWWSKVKAALDKVDSHLQWMKNPMVREQRARVREYGVGGVPVSTTG